MKIRLSCISVLLTLLLFFYYLEPYNGMATTPPDFTLEVSLNDTGDLAFSRYLKKIKKDYFLRQDLLILTGIEVDEYPIAQDVIYNLV